MNANYTGKQIAERRKALRLTQKELAEKLHVTDKAVSKWERGINFPDLGLMEALAAALETTPAVLLGLEDARQDEVVKTMVQFHEAQLAQSAKQLRLAGWLCLVMAALLWVSYTSIAHQRTQAYQILSWVIFGLIGFGMHLLFSNGVIRKWNMGDWLCCYGTVIPIIVYNLGYLVMDSGFPDGVNICCILLSALSIQLLFYRIMEPVWAKALPVIGLVAYNLWGLSRGSVSVIGLICAAVCFALWLLLRRLDKKAQPLPVLKITAAFLAGLMLFGFLCYDSLVKAYVNLRHDHLSHYCETLLESTITGTRYGPWKVSVHPEDGMVEFHTGGGGFGSETSYEGFYYSAEDAHIPFQGADLPVEVYEDTGWWYDDTDNRGTTHRFRKHFYWFEAYF